jgi:hypothetical protein
MERRIASEPLSAAFFSCCFGGLAQSEDMIGDHAKREALLQKAPFAPSFAFLLCPLPVATVRGPQAEHRPAPTGGGYKGGEGAPVVGGWSAGGRH